MAHMCKEMVSTDGIVVGRMCGLFFDDEPWNVGVDAETYHREPDEPTTRGEAIATLTRKEWDRIRARRSPADVKYVFALLQRDGEITIEKDEDKTTTVEGTVTR